jgi:hypothetical protein
MPTLHARPQAHRFVGQRATRGGNSVTLFGGLMNYWSGAHLVGGAPQTRSWSRKRDLGEEALDEVEEPRFGVNTKMKRPSGWAASQALGSLQTWAE